jgi:hypothetical protein
MANPIGIEVECLEFLMNAIDMMNDSPLKPTDSKEVRVSDAEFRKRITMIHHTIRKMEWKSDPKNKGLHFREFINQLKEKRIKNREV